MSLPPKGSPINTSPSCSGFGFYLSLSSQQDSHELGAQKKKPNGEDLLPRDSQHCLNAAQHKGLAELLLLLIPAPLPQTCLEQSLPL